MCKGTNLRNTLNGMLRHAYGKPVIFISLLTYIAPVLPKIPILPPRHRREAREEYVRNKGRRDYRSQRNPDLPVRYILLTIRLFITVIEIRYWPVYSVLGNFSSQKTFSKIVALIV